MVNFCQKSILYFKIYKSLGTCLLIPYLKAPVAIGTQWKKKINMVKNV